MTAGSSGSGDYLEASAILVCALLISLVGGVLMWLLTVLFGLMLFERASGNRAVSSATMLCVTNVFPVVPAFLALALALPFAFIHGASNYWYRFLIDRNCQCLCGSGEKIKTNFDCMAWCLGQCCSGWLSWCVVFGISWRLVQVCCQFARPVHDIMQSPACISASVYRQDTYV